jgi:hypothetical protein
MGALPPTKLLLTKDDTVIGHYTKYSEIALLLGAEVHADGTAHVAGLTDTVKYCMDQYTREEALRDFARSRMLNVIARAGYRIYRYF